MFKSYIQKKLENYVKKYFSLHPEVRLVAVSGSVGKTSTKMAIATVLSTQHRVGMQNNNHNTHMSVPLAILGIEYPEKIRSVSAWLKVFSAARKRIKEPSGVDVIVAELGSDRPGELAHFGSYLRPNIGIVTGVTPEHMEFFGTIETVAQEELAVANFSQIAIINREDIDGRFAEFLTNQALDTYGTTGAAEYRFEIDDFELETGYSGQVIAPEFNEPAKAKIKVVGEHSLRPAMAAVAVGVKLGMTPESIVKGLAEIKPVPGRMNLLRGRENAVLIDDTYNSSPAAASAALQTLYGIQAPQLIAILGDMNELGESSQAEHQKLGNLCDPNLLAWVITIGNETEKYLAPAARARGCQVKSFKTALDAGAFAGSVMEKDAVILVKGSQGAIYAEEAVKILLSQTKDDQELVRQSPAWIETKTEFFTSPAD